MIIDIYTTLSFERYIYIYIYKLQLFVLRYVTNLLFVPTLRKWNK